MTFSYQRSSLSTQPLDQHDGTGGAGDSCPTCREGSGAGKYTFGVRLNGSTRQDINTYVEHTALFAYTPESALLAPPNFSRSTYCNIARLD